MSAEQILRQFVSDCQAAGFEVRPYAGRGYYFGFGVDANQDDHPSDLEVARATRCELRRDSMGEGIILYPAASLSSSAAMYTLAEELGLIDSVGDEPRTIRCWVTLRLAIDVEAEDNRPTREEVRDALNLALSDYAVDHAHLTWGVEGEGTED